MSSDRPRLPLQIAFLTGQSNPGNAALSPQQGRIIELRYFGGLSIEETAEVLGVSTMTVKRGWSMARAWLHRELSGEAG